MAPPAGGRPCGSASAYPHDRTTRPCPSTERSDGPGGACPCTRSAAQPVESRGANAGRSVVASAPALGAGDREFESPRPDHSGAGDPALVSPTTWRWICREERRRDPVPDPRQADRRGSLRGAQAQHGRGLRADRQERATCPGFRKGKVPARIIEQRFGRGAVLEEAVNDALPKAYDEAISTNGIVPVGRPEIDVTELEDGKALTFTAEVDVRPEFDLPDYSSLTVTVGNATPSDADVDEQLDGLRGRFASLTEVDRAAADGDVILVDIAGATAEGDAVEDLVGNALSYELGTDGMLPGFDDAVRGAAKDEERTFEFTPQNGDWTGIPLTVTATVRAVRERELPALDDDFAQLASRVRHRRRAARRRAHPPRARQAARAGRRGPQQRAGGAPGVGRHPAARGPHRRRGRGPLRGRPRQRRRAPRRGRAADPRVAEEPVRARQDRRDRGGLRRGDRAVRVAAPAGAPLRHERRRVRPGAGRRPGRCRWRSRTSAARRRSRWCSSPRPWSTPTATPSTSRPSTPT